MMGVGSNCAQFLYGVALGSGAILADSPEPFWHSTQLHIHSKEERLIEYVRAYGAHEVDEPKPGDIAL